MYYASIWSVPTYRVYDTEVLLDVRKCILWVSEIPKFSGGKCLQTGEMLLCYTAPPDFQNSNFAPLKPWCG